MHKLLHSFLFKREHVRLQSVTVWRSTSTSWSQRWGHWGSTGSVGAEVEGNGISSVSTLAELSPGGATAQLLTWSMWRFPTLPSPNSTSKDRGPHSAVILPATHVGPAAKFQTNTESPSVNCLSWLILSWPAFWRAWALVTSARSWMLVRTVQPTHLMLNGKVLTSHGVFHSVPGTPRIHRWWKLPHCQTQWAVGGHA